MKITTHNAQTRTANTSRALNGSTKGVVEKCRVLIIPASVSAIFLLMVYKHFYLEREN